MLGVATGAEPSAYAWAGKYHLEIMIASIANPIVLPASRCNALRRTAGSRHLSLNNCTILIISLRASVGLVGCASKAMAAPHTHDSFGRTNRRDVTMRWLDDASN